jgi:ATP-binding cassette subfamily B protein
MKLPVRQYFALLWRYLQPRRLSVVLLAVLLVVNITLQLVNPQIIRRFIDQAQVGGTLQNLVYAAALYIALALVTQAVAVVETYVAENLGWMATNQLRAVLTRHCLRLDRSFHATRTPGELIERIDGDVTALANFFSRFIVYVLGNMLLLVGVLVMLFRIHVLVGAALGVFALLAVAILLGLRAVTVPFWLGVRQQSAEYFGFLGERLTGTEDIRGNGAGGYVLRRHSQALRRWLPLEIKANLGWASADGGNVLVFTIGNAIALALSASLFRRQAITLGTVYLIFQYTELLRQPLEQIRQQLQDLQKAAASIGRVQELLAIQPTISDGAPNGTVPLGGPGSGVGAGERSALATEGGPLRPPALSMGALSVALERVTFGYERGERVLDDISITLAPGQVLGVLGHTGSGKTTLSRLLLRFHDPDAGVVRLGGVDVRQLRLAELRRRVGLVTQEVQLFHAPLRDNLTLFDPTIADSRVIAVLEQLGLGLWYRKLPLGLDTELTAGGGLSAGEGQLLAFARVFLRDPGLVILDEASSRLDPATERLVAVATDRLFVQRSGIIIAHRLATIRRVDAVLILEGGRIVEHGAYAALAHDPQSRLSHLLQTGLEVAFA